MGRLRPPGGRSSVRSLLHNVGAMRKLLLDLPSRQPELGFPETAHALARLIDQSEPQFAIGLFGGWGSGKTTLMQAIEERLDADRVVPVRFSAWRYEKEQHLIVPLLDTVREALLSWSASRPQERERARETAKTIGRVMRSILAGMSMTVGVPGAVEVSFDANKALGEHSRGLWGRGNPLTSRRADDEARVPRSFYHASFGALQSSFATFVRGRQGVQRRIVVFVDDLDRCLPESALQVLESMKLFFDLPGFVFVVGLDQRVVEYVIDVKYARPAEGTDNQPRSRVTGAEYIKKIFQVPYRLAPVSIGELDKFLEAAYREADLSPDQRAELTGSVAPHLRWVVGDASVNPREIKRYINAYTLLVEVDAHDNLDARALLALQTIAFRSDWSRIQDALLEYGDVFADALRRQSAGEPNALADLDPELQGIPDDFLEYVAGDAPGRALLNVGPLGPYLSSGEAVRSTQDPVLLDALRAAGSVRRLLHQAAAEASPLKDVAPDVLKTLSLVEGPLTDTTTGAGPWREAVLAGVHELRTALEPFQPDREDRPPRDVDDRTLISQYLEPLARDITRRLHRMYRQGDVAPHAPPESAKTAFQSEATRESFSPSSSVRKGPTPAVGNY
jgi:predicted ATPase